MQGEKSAGGDGGEEIGAREGAPLFPLPVEEQNGMDDRDRNSDSPERDRQWIGMREPDEGAGDRDAEDGGHEDEGRNRGTGADGRARMGHAGQARW